MTEPRVPELATANAPIQALKRVLQAGGDVSLALLFGSRARGDARESSDIDVALLAPSADLLEIGARLSQVSGLEVDVISLADPGVPLLDELLRDGVVLYEAWPGAYASWRSHGARPSRAHWPWYERMREAWLEKVAQRGV